MALFIGVTCFWAGVIGTHSAIEYKEVQLDRHEMSVMVEKTGEIADDLLTTE